MCGIAGFIQSSGRVSKTEIVANMLANLTHRGPDDQGLWSHKNVSLGYTRLSILDTTENGNQPFITNDGKGVLCYNGEIYNFQEIRKKLIKEGVQFKSRCDTEVVLYALHIWGPKKAVSMFNGMFAFAYHNLKTDTLWLGRDSAGIKPLYLYRQNGNFIFASEIKALFEHPSIECRPDMHTVGNYLKNSKLARSTPFEKITEMQPGSLLQIQAGEVSEYSFFDVEQNLDVERILDKQHSSAETLMSELEHIVRASVNSHMISDVPIAAMCSGGVDSSLMTAFACQHKQDLVGYVADVEGVKISEKERAEQIADHLNIELRTVPIKRRDFLRLWPYAAYHNDEPIYFKQNMLHLAVAERVQKDGFKILLCGEGADELFGGYHWQASVYDMWEFRRKRSKLFPDNRLTRFLMRFLPSHPPLDLDQLQKEPFRYLSPDPPIGNIPSQHIIFIEEAKKQLLRKSLMNKLEPLKNIEDRAYLARTFEDFIIHLGISLKCNDRMNMAKSIESRVPFLDTRLIDFAIHLPAHAKYRDGITKFLLKKLAARYLPPELMYKKKVGFGFSSDHWIGTIDFLNDGWVEEQLKWSKKDMPFIREKIMEDSNLLFKLVSTEIWAKIYFGNEKIENLSEEMQAFA